MEHYKEGQYDDDLTVGIDEYDEDFDTGGVDLFDYMGDEESPIARLKSIILSIDWEITDDILKQFNEELIDLKDIWVGNKVNLIYVQALEKISRYIYKEKSSAHPNAIKLLLTFYANLERIVSDEEMSGQEQKKILLEDISRFEKLKKQIAPQEEAGVAATEEPVAKPDESPVIDTLVVPEGDDSVSPAQTSESALLADDTKKEADVKVGEVGTEDPLLNLKAIVYGIDWEITERDLLNLGREVKTLEGQFKSSKAKLIFLQGIGSIGAYINLKRSDSHADAFKLLHSFFTGLETVVLRNLSGQAEKDILMPLVQKFNTFKASIAETLSPEAIAKSSVSEEMSDQIEETEIQPAFSDVPNDVSGFNEEQEAATLDSDEGEDTVDIFFDEEGEEAEANAYDAQLTSEMENRLSGMFEDQEPDESAVKDLEADVALQGVDVESEADDESEEEPLPEMDGELAPALALEDEPVEEESPAVFADKVDDFFSEPETHDVEIAPEAVPGIDVEHEADDDSEEEPLLFEDGEVAPAFAGDEDFEDDEVVVSSEAGADKADIEDRLDDFFGASEESDEQPEAALAIEDEVAESVVEEVIADSPETSTSADVEERLSDFFGDEEVEMSADQSPSTLQGVDVEHEMDDDSDEEPLLEEDGEFAPALGAGADIEDVTAEDVIAEEPFTEVAKVEEDLSFAVDESFDDIFGDEKAVSDVESRVDDLGLTDEAVEVSATEALSGVDVETDEDDDSDEEPLPVEDGELAPAFATDGQVDVFVESPSEDEDALEVDDRFDAVFDDEHVSDTVTDELSEFELDEEEPVPAFSDAEEKEPLFGAVDEETEDETSVAAFEESGFEELLDDALEEIPEIPAEALVAEGEDDGLDLLTEVDSVNDTSGADDEILALLGDDEDIAQELSTEELEAVLLEGTDVVSAGEVPSGYPSADELQSGVGTVAGDVEDDDYADGDDFILSVENPEGEEVVFEAFEETDEVEGEGEEQPAFGDEYDDGESFGTTILSDAPIAAITEEQDDQPVEKSVEDELEESFDEILVEDSSAYVVPQQDTATQDSLTGIRNCIVSLGLEIEDNILSSLTEEIEKLRHQWLNKPAEKTFVQLLSTVTEHIESYRYEADPQANKLLLSVFDKLELCALGQAEQEQIQEALLSETSKVLQWQQRLIDRTPDKNGVVDSKKELAAVEEKTEVNNGVLDDMSKQVDAIGNELLMEKMSSIMKSELEQLKSAFHSELKELKEEIQRGKNT